MNIKELFSVFSIKDSPMAEIVVGLGLSLIGAALTYFVTLLVAKYIDHFCSKTKISFIQMIPKFKWVHKLGYVLMPFVFKWILLTLIPDFMGVSVLSTIADIVGLFFVLVLLFAIFDMALFWSSRKKWSSNLPLSGIFQTLKLVSTIFVVLWVISILIGQSPVYLLSGLGVMTSVLLLVFREPILGLVVSIQLSVNKSLRVGDWVEIPSYGADGNVEEIGLTTVRVRNWDNTATMVPSSALLSHSFRNWRVMQESGRRRIKRSVYINAQSVHFLSVQEQQRLIEYCPSLKESFEAHIGEISNLTAFRYFMQHYLIEHPMISKRLTHMVRVGPIEGQGIPVELYCFTRTTVWVQYEAIQSSLFEFVYASLDLFKLIPYQTLSGSLSYDQTEE